MTIIVRTLGLLTLSGLVILAFLFLYFDSFRSDIHYHQSSKGFYFPCDHSYCSSPSSLAPPSPTPESSIVSDSVQHREQSRCECLSCRSRRQNGKLNAKVEPVVASK